MTKEEFIEHLNYYVKSLSDKNDSSHGWFHIQRVLNNAIFIAEKENFKNIFLIKVVALLHDATDYKYFKGNENEKSIFLKECLKPYPFTDKEIENILLIIENISFNGGNTIKSIENSILDIVQDADRLDAIGAIGIARTFHYGGKKNNEIYDPNISPKLNMTKEEYQKNEGTTINHFYEKLLLLEDKMLTKTGKEIAKERTEFMQSFLNQFYKEWNFNLKN